MRNEMNDCRAEAHRAVDDACDCGLTVEITVTIVGGHVHLVKQAQTAILFDRRRTRPIQASVK